MLLSIVEQTETTVEGVREVAVTFPGTAAAQMRGMTRAGPGLQRRRAKGERPRHVHQGVAREEGAGVFTYQKQGWAPAWAPRQKLARDERGRDAGDQTL